MASENVEQRLEKYVPTFEQLISIGIFTQPEVKEIIRKRRSFEYQLQSKYVQIDNFMNYIQYETAVMELTEQRKAEKGIDSTQRLLSDSDWPKHIHSIFRRATHRFSGNLDVWNAYFDFCQQTHSIKSLNSAFAECVRLHGHEPKLWKRAAKWEMYENGNHELAKSYMEQAIKKIPGKPSLYALYAESILALTKQIEGRREIQNIIENSDTTKAPLLIFKNALSECNDKPKVVRLFLELFKKYEKETDEIINLGIATKDPNVLCYIAEIDPNPKGKFEQFIQEYPSRELKIKYAEYLGKNNNPKEMIKILDDIGEFDDNEVATFVELLLNMKEYQEASDYLNTDDLTPEMRRLKLRLLNETVSDNDTFINLSEEFLKKFNTPELNDQFVFCLAVREIPPEQWIMILKQKAIYIKPESIAKALKFTLLQYGEEVAYDLMNELMPIIVPIPEFIDVSIEILKSQKIVDNSKIRSLHELNTTKWGSNNDKVWLDYCQFEYDQKNLTKLEAIRRRANRNLEDSISFNREYQERFCK
ncbi:U3 small nucleolar RNA-associated protein 6 [Histomonas meleagridis]|uniref:U3 small nucleolar RNA-associated protein 6-like n=1 Tax=Histomonas meleagridis TaxID=135588 RepID=UPI00355A4F46|nr:U3 small nucleolar RNA-associated protein 6 [Histomonas meleagridis]KAH0799224.1 U3 small nucleolar RNA-associated protein 6-like [Histomonas meleagridis]